MNTNINTPPPQPPILQAIETEWGGYRFRSRLEARWAVLFTEIGVNFQYEPEGFELPSGRYLPDFYLPHVRMFAEVKPTEFTDTEKQKCLELTDATGAPCILLVGPPDFRTYNAVHAADIEGTAERWETDYLLDVDWHERRHYHEGRLYGCTDWERRVSVPAMAFSENYRRAVTIARGMRFGDKGRW